VTGDFCVTADGYILKTFTGYPGKGLRGTIFLRSEKEIEIMRTYLMTNASFSPLH
jgi:hypothetical protein